MHSLRISSLLCLAALLSSQFLVTGPRPKNVEYITFAEAKPILEAMAEALPAGLSGQPLDKLESLWPAWVKSRDEEIRKRLMGGDEDTIINFLLFGTTFTHERRLTSAQVRALAGNGGKAGGEESAAKFQQLVGRRIQDLVNGMAAPGNNERLLFARRVAERRGIRFADETARKQAAKYVLENYLRVLKEQESFQQELAAAKSLDDPTEEFVERSKLYRERGLSLDTSLPPDYALEESLKEMSARGLVKPGSVKRVGIIGPGLDFTDKQEGYDFYPTQTVQPFAVMDSLLRLKLARADELQVLTLDLSPRVNDHIERSRRAAMQGRGYTIQLLRDPSRGWKPELVAYWKRFGDQIGGVVTPVAVPASLQGTILRAVRVRPEFVRGIRAIDLNVVLQREDSQAEAKFDLVIATNILVYYDTFEQALALNNIQSMLRPAGFLLSNNALLELPSGQVRSVGYHTTEYSDHLNDGDHIVWYRREFRP